MCGCMTISADKKQRAFTVDLLVLWRVRDIQKARSFYSFIYYFLHTKTFITKFVIRAGIVSLSWL